MIDYPIHTKNLSDMSRNCLQKLSKDKHAKTPSKLFNFASPKNDAITLNTNHSPDTKPLDLSSCSGASMCVGILTALAIGADCLFFKGKHANKLLSKLRGNKIKLFKQKAKPMQ